MFVPPSAIKFTPIHSEAFPIISLVAGTKDEENNKELPLKAITLKASTGLSFGRAANIAVLTFSIALPCMLPLMSTKNTTSFPKTCNKKSQIHWICNDTVIIVKERSSYANQEVDVLTAKWDW